MHFIGADMTWIQIIQSTVWSWNMGHGRGGGIDHYYVKREIQIGHCRLNIWCILFLKCSPHFDGPAIFFFSMFSQFRFFFFFSLPCIMYTVRHTLCLVHKIICTQTKTCTWTMSFIMYTVKPKLHIELVLCHLLFIQDITCVMIVIVLYWKHYYKLYH